MKLAKPIWRGLFFFFTITALCAAMAMPFMVPVQAAPHLIYPASNVVISEFRFVGPTGGNDEFVELYNPTGSAIDISGWLIRGSNNVGTIATRATINGGTILQPGQYYLVTHTGYTSAVVANQTYGTGITNDGGVALTLADGTTIIDQVGLSAGSAYKEGATLTSLATNVDRGYERRIGGANGSCQDDANNATDFTLVTPSTPQNAASAFILCGTPTNTPPPTIDVYVNEVAWAGTRAFSGDEWIELYNAGTAAADLTNWRIEAADGDPSILLSGSLPASGYLLLERNSQNVTSALGTVYTSGLLSDSGETLYLLDNTSTIVDTVNANGGGWSAGSGSPNFPTMERIGNVVDTDFAWLTFANTVFTATDAGGNNVYGTPGGVNWAFGLIPSPSPTNTFTPTATFTPTNTATFTPTNTVTPAGTLSVIINEVAWAGTAASSSDEWIELYNPGAMSINLNGWVLRSPIDSTPNIVLTGTIPAGGYYLLERTDDDTVSDILADQIYSGDLGNTTDLLHLFDPANRLIDTANVNGGAWPAGSSSTFGSMERRGVMADSDIAWITNTGVIRNGLDANGAPIRGTPKNANWALNVTPTKSATPTVTRSATPVRTATRTLTPAPAQLVAINEFVPRPARDWNNDTLVNTGDEYIELINHGTVSVNLSGWTLDDEANEGSEPFSLPSLTIAPGERAIFYASETGLLLSDGGDGVRLLKPNGQLVDAYNYRVVRFPDQSYCRLPDNGGLDDWSANCFPTPGLRNLLNTGVSSPSIGEEGEELCPIADTIPFEFVFAECDPFGNGIWNFLYWDETGWLGEQILPFNPDLFAD